MTADDPNEAAMAEDTVTNHSAAALPGPNFEVVLTLGDPNETAMAEDIDMVADHNAAAVYPEVDEIIEGSSAEMAMAEDWSMDLAATLARDDRPSQFLVPYASLLPSAMRVSQWMATNGQGELIQTDTFLNINLKADGDEEPSQADDLFTSTQGTFMDAPTLNVTLGISRL